MAERDKREKHPGSRIYRQPVLVVYKLNGEYCAQITHPLKPVPPNAIKKATEGINTVMGKWLDLGYSFGIQRDIIPEWFNVPENAEYLFCRSVTHTPLIT